MLDILDICIIRGKVPRRVHFIAVVPESLDAGMELTPLLQGRIKDVLQILADKLGEEAPLTSIAYAQVA